MPRQVPDQQISRLNRYVADWLGLHFPKKRWRDLERIIIHAAPELGFQAVDECIERLVAGEFSAHQANTLAGRLTIGETYFFREQNSFDFLEHRILADLIAARRGRDQRLRIWSAGCSTGEEPYSLAIILNRLLPDIRDWQVTILATDINTQALARAGQGLYREWSFRGVPEPIRQRYFTMTAEGLFELSYAIRTMVTFAVLNLAEDSYPSLSTNTNAMDVIFCRNVLMYFEPRCQQQVISGFHRSLLDNGWLIVSPCEVSPAFSRYFDTVMFPGGFVYRKGGRGTKPQPSVLGELSGTVLPVPLPSEQVAPPLLSVSPKQPAQQKRRQVPASPESSCAEALALYRQGRYDEAAAVLSRVLECPAADNRPQFGKAAILLAQSLANQGKIAPALEWTERAIAVDKLNAELYYLRATIQQEQGAEPQAIATLRQALYLDPNFVLAHFALATLTLREKPGEADRHFENALALLGACGVDDPVPGADGMTAGRLVEVIASTRESMKH
ncbi:MAG TPA: CheR family methyltransferase [Desulfuromonadaceae bacterium]